MEPGVSVMGSVLSIPSLEVRHSGIYQCFARNVFRGQEREDSRAWILEVRRPGKIELLLPPARMRSRGKVIPLGTYNCAYIFAHAYMCICGHLWKLNATFSG